MNNTKELTQQEKVIQEWDGMAGEWDDLAAGYAQEFYKILLEKVDTFHTVVDFGCGTGLLTKLLHHKAHRILALDASTAMVRALRNKIRDMELDKVDAVSVVLSQLHDESKTDSTKRQLIEEYENQADLIVASSVLTFIPPEDAPATMKELGKLLKPGGILCHSDWPKSEAHHPDAMTIEKAEALYQAAGLVMVSTEIIKGQDGMEGSDIFFGVARKP